MDKKRGSSKFAVFFFLVGMILHVGSGAASAEEKKSSCVTCHLDSNMLIQSLAKGEAKTSALQSGAG